MKKKNNNFNDNRNENEISSGFTISILFYVENFIKSERLAIQSLLLLYFKHV